MVRLKFIAPIQITQMHTNDYTADKECALALIITGAYMRFDANLFNILIYFIVWAFFALLLFCSLSVSEIL